MRYSDFKHTAKHASAQAKHASAQREQTKMQGKHARRETFLVGKRVSEGANIQIPCRLTGALLIWLQLRYSWLL